ncbi:helix-turn-helix transcriptional regulator [Arthrobacter sp. NicSoilB8]|uniref:helix-turn-helix domain-containing protein n=1 Tax=Arthrobacter sp. NicSoilB8 TaxID=2830998 RepID=UPI001CC44743|nr:helix-turn-helix transcriptional regulator [Arthrobacter sp. NicSoilB8]BCW70349.1 hypothetical protein NicSoilB8_13930 [Arthrobacter sp. NicSoilB8]
MSATLVSYYDMTLELIRERIEAVGMTSETVASWLGISTEALSQKLSGETVLTVREIGDLAEVLGCLMSDIVA